VTPLTDEELKDENEANRHDEFTKQVTKFIDQFDESLIHSIEREEMAEPIFDNPDDDEEDNATPNHEPTPGLDEFKKAEIYLLRGDRTEIARVIGRKRNRDGNYIGRKHANPFLDSRVFIVEFSDGEQRDVGFNILAEHLFSQVDEEGN